MPRLVKAHDERDSTVFEVSLLAISDIGARFKASAYLFGRVPGKIPAVSNVETMGLSTGGVVGEYRVMITVDDEGEIRDILRLDNIRDDIERFL